MTSQTPQTSDKTNNTTIDLRQARLASPVAKWLGFETTERRHVFRMCYREHHIGNPFIRALHGGAVATMIDFCAEYAIVDIVDSRAELVSSAINYLRVTKDVDVFARVDVVRVGRRVAFVDVWCWQDAEDVPVARGSCTLRILED